MRQFFYAVRDRQQQRQSGVLCADDRHQAMDLLRQRFAVVLRVEEVVRPPGSWWGRLRPDRPGPRDLLTITHQLHSMLEASLSLHHALDILLLERVHRRGVRKILVQVAASVAEGRSLSEALRQHPQLFPPLYVSLVEAGENSAELPAVLKRLADYLERLVRLQNTVFSALLYPLCVLCCGLLVAGAVALYGAPVIDGMYRSAGLQLPWSTAVLVTLAGLARKLALPLAFGTALTGLLCARQLRGWLTGWAERWCHLGPLGELVLQAAVARSCRTLATLYAGGVPMLQALELTSASAGHPALARLFEQVRQGVAGGRSISEELLASALFPPLAAGMIAAGETAGSLPSMLTRVAEHYEMQLEFAAQAFTRMIEPALILVVGTVIGGVILLLGLPFMNLVGVLQ